MRELTQPEADEIQALLLETPLDWPIRLEFTDAQTAIDIADSALWHWSPKGCDLTGPGCTKAHTRRSQIDIRYLELSDWSVLVRLALGDMHLTICALGSFRFAVSPSGPPTWAMTARGGPWGMTRCAACLFAGLHDAARLARSYHRSVSADSRIQVPLYSAACHSISVPERSGYQEIARTNPRTPIHCSVRAFGASHWSAQETSGSATPGLSADRLRLRALSV